MDASTDIAAGERTGKEDPGLRKRGSLEWRSGWQPWWEQGDHGLLDGSFQKNKCERDADYPLHLIVQKITLQGLHGFVGGFEIRDMNRES